MTNNCKKPPSKRNNMRLSAVCRSLLAMGFSLAAFAAHACVEGRGGNLVACAGGLKDFPIAEGEWISGGLGEVNFLQGCTDTSERTLSLNVDLSYIGEYGGIPTFQADASGNVGVQISIDGGAALQDGNNVISRRPVRGEVSLRFGLAFVALRDLSANTYRYGEIGDYFGGSSEGSGVSLPSVPGWGTTIEERVQAYCTFGTRPPANVTVPTTLRSSLAAAGNVGPAGDFSFSWTCNEGNTGWTGGADFRYKSSHQVVGMPGRLFATGTAGGVDLLVTRRHSDGKDVPIVFDTWYSREINGSRPLPRSGSENLKVRFIRNADEVMVGDARSDMVVEVLMW